jgi:hypothetical protein
MIGETLVRMCEKVSPIMESRLWRPARRAVIRLSGRPGRGTMRAMSFAVRPVESVAELAELRARRGPRLSSR